MPKKKPQSNVMVIKLASHEMPQFKEVHGGKFVSYGKKNDYPQYLLDLFYKCSKHNAIVNGKTKYIVGGGWGDDGGVLVNSDGETLNQLTWKCTLDEEIYGGYAMEVIWTKGGKTAEFRHVDFSKVRTNKDSSEYYFTNEWFTPSGYPKHDPQSNPDWEVYEPFDPENRTGKQLMYYKGYSPGLDVYPLPEYKAAVQYVELEYQIANYWYNRVGNGFMPSAILNFYNGIPTDAEMKALEEKIKSKFGGTDNAGQFILNFAPNKDSGATIEQITPPELGAEYEALNKTLQTEIFTGHGVTNGMLFGIKEAGQLGGRSELIEANELFQNRYVTPKQLKIEEYYSKYIFPYIGVDEAHLVKLEPIGYMFSESVMVKYLPERAIAEMVAKKMGLNLKDYPEYESERAEKKEAEQAEKQRFSKAKKEKTILEILKAKGKKRKIKEVLYSRPVTFEMSKNLKGSEEELRMTFAKKEVPVTIIGNPQQVIKNPLGDPDEIISVVYKYDWIENIPLNERNTEDHPSREFCVEMMQQSEAGVTWDRQDIDTLDNDAPSEVSDVWESRGGYWNDNGFVVPHCRHQFIQQVVRQIK